MKKLLFISHYFPPSGGGGVQRPAYFVRHLPKFGWVPTVVTSENVRNARWAPPDDSLSAVVPPGIVVRRVKLDRSSNEQDEQRLNRLERFYTEGCRCIDETRPDAILVTMSPFTDATIAARLSNNYNIPWVADLRDPWALDEFQVYPSRWHRALARRQMFRSLQSAACIILNTPEAVKKARAHLPRLSDVPITNITNGFAREDFPTSILDDAQRVRKFHIVHSGTFHVELGMTQRRRRMEYRLLGRTEPGVDFLPRSHYYLLCALQQLVVQEPSAAREIEVVCLGVASPADIELVRGSSVSRMFRITGYLPHSQSVESVRSAELLFLPMHKMPSGARATIVPGKTYEYMASGRPILGAVPEGDCRDLLRKCGTADVCDPDDVSAIKGIIEQRYNAWKQRKALPKLDVGFVSNFERENLTSQLASVLDQAVAQASAPRAS